MKTSWTAGLGLAAGLAAMLTGCLGHRLPGKPVAATELGEFYSLAADPVDAAVVYAGTATGSYQMTIGAGPPAVLAITPGDVQSRALAILPGEPRRILVGGLVSGLWLTEKTGSRWQASHISSAGSSSVTSLFVDPEAGLVYAATGAGLLVSPADKLAFRPIESLPAGSTPRWVFADPALPGVIQLVDFNQTQFLSRDRGLTWDELPRQVYLHSLDVRRDGASVGTLTNQESSITFPALKIVAKDEIGTWSVNPFDSHKLLLTGFGSGIFRVERRGSTWSSYQAGKLGSQVRAVAYSPVQAELALAAEPRMIYRTTDGGASWDPLWEAPANEPAAK